MFLSLFLSFVLARKLGSKTYGVLMIVVIVLVSFFSTVGIGGWLRYPWGCYILPVSPVPLSFPFHTYIRVIEPRMPGSSHYYHLDFLTVPIIGSEVPVKCSLFLLIYSFFILVNIIGAILGYWIGKSAILKMKESKTREQVIKELITPEYVP